MAAELLGADVPILEYREPPPDRRSELALQFSCMLSGAAVFAILTLAMFAGSIYLHAPDLLGLYPIAFVLSVMATVAEGKWTRLVGMGAVAGSVLISMLGYAIGLFFMMRL